MKQLRTIFLSFTLVTLASCAVAGNNPHAKGPYFHSQTITVSGHGNVSARPDVAEIQVAVLAAASSAGKAMIQASEKAKVIIKAATKQGVAKADIQTGTVSLSPVYKSDIGKAKNKNDNMNIIVGHRATLSSRIMVRHIDTIGVLLDNLISAGAIRFTGIRFMVSTKEEKINEARVLAIKDARAVAVLMAREAGVELGDVLKIEDAGNIMPKSRMRDVANESIGVPVMPGEIEVIASVNVVFAIKRAP